MRTESSTYDLHPGLTGLEQLSRLIDGCKSVVAQELHTTAAGTLSSIGLEAEASLDQPLPEHVRERLKAIRRRAGCGSQQVRSAIFALKASYSEPDNAIV